MVNVVAFSGIQPLQDVFQHSAQILEHVVVPDPHNFESLALQPIITNHIR